MLNLFLIHEISSAIPGLYQTNIISIKKCLVDAIFILKVVYALCSRCVLAKDYQKFIALYVIIRYTLICVINKNSLVIYLRINLRNCYYYYLNHLISHFRKRLGYFLINYYIFENIV